MRYVKVFLLPLPRDVPELQRQTILAISEISRDMLQRVRVEMDYRLDICHFTKSGHIRHLRGTLRNLEEFLFPSVGYRLQSVRLSTTQFYELLREL